MVDFSIKALTAPFVPPVQRYFARVTKSITSKDINLSPAHVNHDFKVLMFDAASALLVTTVTLAYFKIIALVTAVAFVTLFYFIRQIIDATFLPLETPSETTTELQSVLEFGNSLVKKRASVVPLAPPNKSFRERIVEMLCQDDKVLIKGFVLMKTTHYPMPKVIGMLLTRSP